ncbi:hypothetical protein CsSME_00030900 [Camellia sinensis var. sinensis]
MVNKAASEEGFEYADVEIVVAKDLHCQAEIKRKRKGVKGGAGVCSLPPFFPGSKNIEVSVSIVKPAAAICLSLNCLQKESSI